MARPSQLPILLLGVVAALTLSGLAARAEGPVYKDTERFDPARPERGVARFPVYEEPGYRKGPPRRVTGGPGYVGSDYGLGKPAFTGLGSRPDWGRSSE